MDEQTIATIIKLIEESKMDEWRKNYATQLAYNLQVHTKGLMFDKITGLYPNEHPDSQKHCIQSYESITKGSIWKAINNIIRVFNNSSYNIEISDKTRDAIDTYQGKEGSLFSQFLEDWIKYAIATDPNGICVAYPPEYLNDKDYGSDDLYRYICFERIVLINDEVLIFISEDESEKKIEMIDTEYAKEIFFDYENLGGQPNVKRTTVKTYNRRLEKKIANPVYHVFTKTHFIRFWKEEIGDSEFSYKWWKYKNEFETLPYFENGGIEIEEDVYESFIHPFVPFGNLALMSHRNQRATDLLFSYPRMAEVQQPCDDCQGTGKEKCLITAQHPSGEKVCHACHGSKFITPQSPYKVYRKVRDSFDVDNKVLSTPSVEFYTPPVGIIDYNNKQWQQYLSMAEMAVFVQQKVETGNVQAAKSKEIDREELYAWLANISKVLYNNLQMFLQYMENYINSSPIEVSVECPVSFAILTEAEAFESLNAMLTSPAPVLLKASQIDNFVNKFISESSPVKRSLEILKKYDLLLYYSNSDVVNAKSQGFVDTKMCQKHTLAYPVLIQMYELDKELFDLEDEQIIEKLDAELKQYELTTDLKTNVLKNAGI